MNRFKIFIIFLLILGLNYNTAYSQGATDANNSILAAVFQESGNNVINIYSVKNNTFIKQLKFDLKNTGKIDSLIMNPAGNLLAVRQTNNYFIFNIAAAKQIARLYVTEEVALANEGDFFIALKTNIITKYDANTGAELIKYEMPINPIVTKLKINANDDFLAAISKDKVVIWDTKKIPIVQQYNGFDITFSGNGKNATIIRADEELIKTAVYKLPAWEITKTTASDKLLEPYPVGGLGKLKLVPLNSTISKNGQFVALYTEKSDEVVVYLFNTYTGKFVFQFNNYANTANKFRPQIWTADSTLVAYGENLMAGEYNTSFAKATPLALKLDATPTETDLTYEQQLNNRLLSPNMKYVAMQTTREGKPYLHIRASEVQASKITFAETEFVAFSKDSKYMFVKKDNNLNIILLTDVNKSMTSNIAVPLNPINKVSETVTKEETILKDVFPPDDNKYYSVEKIEKLTALTDTELKLLFRSIVVNNEKVEIQVNLVDEKGNLYTGASAAELKKIWCNIILQYPDGVVSQINDFVIEETIDDKKPTAIALVLDHSGSMGDTRINTLQYGASNLISAKNTNDGFLLIKYDDKLKLEVPYSLLATVFSSALSGTGSKGYGGATALIDASYMGVRKISKIDKIENKIVILFTDGYENASMFTKTELMQAAIDNKIEINIVGFGENVNEDFLKSIAYTTGGSFYHIYQTDELKKIFVDIEYKRRNYYSIKFQSKQKGEHITLMQLCHNGLQDSLIVPFNNNIKNLPLDKIELIPEIKAKTFKIAEFKKLIIPPEKILKPVVTKEITKEFDKIEFPDILFQTSSADIISSEEKGISQIVDFLVKYPKLTLEISGHTDNVGDANANLLLSKQRAEQAKNLIVAKGIAEKRIITKGYGQTMPKTTNDTDEGRKQNRRIEFKILE